jgi:DNA repair ATPase RecN
MLDEIETRLDLISTLKRKYGANIAEVLAFRDRSEEELDRIGNAKNERNNSKPRMRRQSAITTGWPASFPKRAKRRRCG